MTECEALMSLAALSDKTAALNVGKSASLLATNIKKSQNHIYHLCAQMCTRFGCFKTDSLWADFTYFLFPSPLLSILSLSENGHTYGVDSAGPPLP